VTSGRCGQAPSGPQVPEAPAGQSSQGLEPVNLQRGLHPLGVGLHLGLVLPKWNPFWQSYSLRGSSVPSIEKCLLTWESVWNPSFPDPSDLPLNTGELAYPGLTKTTTSENVAGHPSPQKARPFFLFSQSTGILRTPSQPIFRRGLPPNGHPRQSKADPGAKTNPSKPVRVPGRPTPLNLLSRSTIPSYIIRAKQPFALAQFFGFANL
jgi:hypothetical protein